MKTKKPIAHFLRHHKIGLILRTYAQKREDVERRVAAIVQMVKAAESIEIEGERVFFTIDVLVWADPRFEGESDCGETAAALRAHSYLKWNQRFIKIREVKHGDLFVQLLNYGMTMQRTSGVQYSLVASTEVVDHMTAENLRPMIQAIMPQKGPKPRARAVGLAISELSDSIREGRIANTFGLWHLESLQTVGGFSMQSAKPRPSDQNLFLKGRDASGNQRDYHLAGVEEVIPLARLVHLFDEPCIAVVEPHDADAQYQIPTDPDLLRRHLSKMATKQARQDAQLQRAGFHPSILKNGVIRS